MAGKKGQTKNGLVRKAAKLKGANPTMTHAEIGKKIGRCRDVVGRLLSTEEAKQIIQACHSRIVEKAPDAVGNIIHAVDEFQDALDSGDRTKASICWDATKLVAQIPGLAPSGQQSVVHQTFINQQTNVLDPLVSELINKYLSNIIDITPKGESDAQTPALPPQQGGLL